MDSILSVRNKNFSRDGKEFKKVSRAVRKAKSNSYRQFIIPFRAMVECYRISTRDQSRLHQFGKNVLIGIFLRYALIAGNLERRYFGSRPLKNWRRWTHQQLIFEESTQKKQQRHKRLAFHSPNCRWYGELVGKRP